MTFQIHGLDHQTFAPLFELSDADLAAHRAVRVKVDIKPGFPDRIALRDAEPGETLLLVNYEHQRADSPYRSSHAVYVSQTATEAALMVDSLPPYFTNRSISLRAFDGNGMILRAELVDGADAAPVIESLLADPKAAYLHAHFAQYGCFAARIERA
jgi:hypothetical protein